MSDISLSVTPAAFTHIQRWIEQQAGTAFRLSLEQRGCSGFAYVTEIVTEPQTDDVVVEINVPLANRPALTIYLEQKNLNHLKGLCIDFQLPKEGGGILKQPRLVFLNPNQKGECGCGESFSV